VHLIKSGVRMGVNASPEPFSNVIVSLTENVTVAGIVVLTLLHPLVAALIAAALLVLGAIVVALLASRIRKFWRRRRERRLGGVGGRPASAT
jgi:cobalamin synthase